MSASVSPDMNLPLRPSFNHRPDTRFKSDGIHWSFRSVGDGERSSELPAHNSLSLRRFHAIRWRPLHVWLADMAPFCNWVIESSSHHSAWASVLTRPMMFPQ